MFADFNTFSIEMTEKQAREATPGVDAEESIRNIIKRSPKIRRQLDKIPMADIIRELRETGADYSEEELADGESNKIRILWIAAGNIVEEIYEKKRGN